MEENVRKSHNLILEDRKKFTLTGVRDVLSFDEMTDLSKDLIEKLRN